MKKSLVHLLIIMLIFSGCIGKNAVKNGDTISVDYTGSFEDGKVLDTSNESVAKDNNLFTPGREYKPLQFIVGKGSAIKGLDEGVLGMKVGDSKTLTIPPEKAYGPVDPRAIQVIPILQNFSATRVIPRINEIELAEFEDFFGRDHKIGENVQLQNTNMNLTILNISSNVSLSFNHTVGYKISRSGIPWNETVEKIDDKNVTLRVDVKKNDMIQLPRFPWNTTVVDVNNENITLRHNAIPDTIIPNGLRQMKISFNDTSIIIDGNHELAGKTVIFNITLKSIDR